MIPTQPMTEGVHRGRFCRCRVRSRRSRDRHIRTIIPERSDQQRHRRYRGRTRYDKLAVVFRGGAIVRSIFIWLAAL